ncbi:DNA-binding MurR/RpiR family transcriptional regulator [Angulomicrobium tetraedrale]|uniref:DNA-binding MurR/RpiR family transcriptional regulator n=1 Tax=Ancylobacter tetraedralis TaxID=217068 RepID=A0A839Z8U4_9HYPH|nr:MurR/RpiR family transcriptional regulator [Ancylobacter tetraedralis]MBB3769987.1 DNA-binding MurR/RpiR family transcriptional regulator [Ancylobacter tetraedralis]
MPRDSHSPTTSNSQAGTGYSGPLAYLEASMPSLPNVLARTALYIVENPEKVVRFSLKELSRLCRAGEASIIRLCQMSGFNGFSDFKLALAGELAVRDTVGTEAVPKDEHQLLTLAGELSRSVTRTAEGLDLALVQKVADRLRPLHRIDIYGSGVSGIIAELFSYRLLRSRLNAHAFRDVTLAHEVANGLGPHSAAIAISESGVTLNTVDFLRTARAAGAYCVAVTCHPKSALARHADVVLPMAKLNIPAYGGYINAVPRAVYIAEALAALAAPRGPDIDA